MATHLPKPTGRKPDRAVMEWLLDSDLSIRWQVLRDLMGAPAPEVAAERARVLDAAEKRRIGLFGAGVPVQ